MSSAILYLAIIAIWAGVLIPRWLRRDSARGHLEQDAGGLPTAEADTTGPFDTVPAFSGEPASSAGDILDETSAPGDADPDAPEAGETATSADTRDPVSAGESRRRVLAARRRLLWMLLALEAAADALAATGLGAWWVIAPPTVMLTGYLLVLRAAAQADAERDARERDAAQARERARHARPAGHARLAQPPSAPPATPAVFAAAPVPEDYEDLGPGRDFTPGGRYTAAADDSDTEAYDQYAEERLRAVGD
jgi:hypothetical protein